LCAFIQRHVGVLGIHEDVRSDLQLREDAARPIDRVRSGASRVQSSAS
jgi:hypothetical protein